VLVDGDERVIEHGSPLVDDPDRVGVVRQLGVDETSFLTATRSHPTIYATRAGRSRAAGADRHGEGQPRQDLRAWTAHAGPAWLAGVEVVATDLAESFRAGLSPHLDHARRVADPFHVVRVRHAAASIRCAAGSRTRPSATGAAEAIRCIGSARCSWPAERLDDTGRHRMLLNLRLGDPHEEVAGAWLAG
jgi:transposase